MLLETVDVGYWLLMPVLSCICLAVAILVASSSGGDGQRCCRRKRFQDDVSCVEDGQKCSGGNGGSNEDDPTKKAVEGDNPDDDDVFLADIVTPMRSFSECHLRPYLYEPSHGEKSKKAIIVVRSFERNRNVVNTLTEQVHHPNFSVASTGELLSKAVEIKGSTTSHAMSLHGDQAPAPAEDQMQSDLSTSPRGTYENCLGCRREDCNRAMSDIYDDAIECCIRASEGGSVRTYTELRSSSTEFLSGTTTVASYTRLRNQDTDSSDLTGSTTSDSRTLLANGDENAYNCSLSDSNLYDYTLPEGANTKSDTPQPPADGCIAMRPTVGVWHSCDRRRSEVESGHYSTLDDTHNCCNGTMSGIYDIIEDPKYKTVCTTSPAATKQEHELKAKDKAEMEAAKRKTMMHAPIGETQLTKASTNEVY